MSDRASKALAEACLPGDLRTYDAISKRNNVPLSTLHHRACGRPSKEDKARGQLYLNPSQEKGLARYAKLMFELGNPVRIKFLSSIAFSMRQRSMTDETIKPPGKNWAQGFQKRHPDIIRSRRVRPMPWERHENNIEAIGPRILLLDGTMPALNPGITTLRSAWSGSSACLIPKLENKLTRSRGY